MQKAEMAVRFLVYRPGPCIMRPDGMLFARETANPDLAPRIPPSAIVSY